LEQKKKIALFTADTYRIAAAEQLHTYANILEVPFQIIYTQEEIKEAIAKYTEYDYILVDTAGHSHHDELQKNEMQKFLHCLDGSVETEVYLVVSATTKYSTLVSIADYYSEIADYKIIFTKLDETTTLGNILNLKLHTGAELAYITCGQNVPDDIDNFNAQHTVKLLLGGKK
jgi:flagellar biosynthesis protein FlhF